MHDVEADLEVMTVHRDASMYEAIPEGTWVLCFGWYMHAIFSDAPRVPAARNLRPIFVSFHCNKRDLLTPEAVEYLRRYGPVGCRDWTTVHLLLSLRRPGLLLGLPDDHDRHGVPRAGPRRAGRTRRSPTWTSRRRTCRRRDRYRHSSDPTVRRRSFVANVRAALELLETYRTRHRRVVTSRLHCYLPVRSLGVDVDFRPPTAPTSASTG